MYYHRLREIISEATPSISVLAADSLVDMASYISMI